MSDVEGMEARLARIDENVKVILGKVQAVEQLKLDSELNKQEHKIAIAAIGVISTPLLLWAAKKLGMA